MPPTRELTREKPREGREGGLSRKCSQKMAHAMERWLQEGTKADPEARRPIESPQGSNRKGHQETDKERDRKV